MTLASSPDCTAGVSPLSLTAPPSCCHVASAGVSSPSLPVPVHPLHLAAGDDVGISRVAGSGELLLAHVIVFSRPARSSPAL